jgi:hypothetical protein
MASIWFADCDFGDTEKRAGGVDDPPIRVIQLWDSTNRGMDNQMGVKWPKHGIIPR